MLTVFDTDCIALVKQKFASAQDKMKKQFHRCAKHYMFGPGDQVLVLLPVVGSPFQAWFTGHYTVAKQLSEHDYLISNPDHRKSTQLCHVNLLKPYYA